MKKVKFNPKITFIDEPVELALALRMSRISDLPRQKAILAHYKYILSPLFTETHREKMRQYIKLQNEHSTQ